VSAVIDDLSSPGSFFQYHLPPNPNRYSDEMDSDGESNFSMDSVESSATSNDGSMRSRSPASVISINSNMEFYKEEHGRLINTRSDIYQLPADQEEFDRLGKSLLIRLRSRFHFAHTDQQHDVLTRIMGYKYVPGMEELMAHVKDQPKKSCLDLGCGSGSW
jgi:hypothetical protein